MPQQQPEWQWIIQEAIRLLKQFGVPENHIWRRMRHVSGVERTAWLTPFTGPVVARDLQTWVERLEDMRADESPRQELEDEFQRENREP